MDTQAGALSKIIGEGEIQPFIDAKIDAKFFPDSTHRKVFDLVMEHYRKYSAPPTAEVVHKAYPTYKVEPFPEQTSYYLNQLQQDRKKVILTEAVQSYASRLQAEPGPAVGDDLELILRQGMANAAHEISHGKDTDFFLSKDRIVERITERSKMGGKIRGITTGFETLDQITGGLQKQHLITFVGLPKSGKSSVLLTMALAAKQADYNPLFLTFEMTTEEQEDRLLSLLTKIDLTKIDRGDLNDPELARIERAMRTRETMAGFTITSDISSALTLTGAQAKVIQYKPDVLFVDGVYLMDDETGHDQGSPQALTALTRGFKRMCQNLEIPIVISTQALAWKSKGGLNVNSIGYSSSFLQDSDKILGTEASVEAPNLSKLMTMGQRTGRIGNTYIEFDWGHGSIEEIPEDEYTRRIAQALPPTGEKGKSGLQSAWDEDD